MPLIAQLSQVHFFFNDPATTEIYSLSLHDALPIWRRHGRHGHGRHGWHGTGRHDVTETLDRKSTRLNSSHVSISYAVFCLKKKRWLATSCSSTTPQWPCEVHQQTHTFVTTSNPRPF